MKSLTFIFVAVSLGITLFSCSSQTNNDENFGDPELRQFTNTMKQALDSNNAEVVMERDTSK
ncbi:MAG: hypothetical protein Fur0028_08600 [Bacteroidales bacterium]